MPEKLGPLDTPTGNANEENLRRIEAWKLPYAAMLL